MYRSARPWIFPCQRGDGRANRIAFHVTHGPQKMVPAQRAGKKTILPEMAGAVMPPVDVLGIAKMHPSDGPRQSVGTVRCGNEVNVVGHQTEAEDRHMRGDGFLGQYAEVGTAIILDEKNRLTVISTLGNVVGYIGDDNASGSKHEEQGPTIRSGCQETGDCRECH